MNYKVISIDWNYGVSKIKLAVDRKKSDVFIINDVAKDSTFIRDFSVPSEYNLLGVNSEISIKPD